MSKNFVELTRIYVETPKAVEGSSHKPKAVAKTQSFVINVNAVASVRPSNRLGKTAVSSSVGHRTTVTLIDGSSVDVTNDFKSVQAMLTKATA